METINRKWLSLAVLTWMAAFALQAQEAKTIAYIDASASTAYVSLVTGQLVQDAAGDWDIAFNRTTISVKQTAALLKDTSFEKVTKRPESGFKADSGQEKAIPTGSGNGWYAYNMADHSINPIPGRVLVVKTASGKYAKVEILSYYNKDNHNSAEYTFRYGFL